MTDPAKHFADMASRIERVEAGEFAGAVVVVPPGDGQPISFMLTDPSPNVAQFWSSVLSRVQIAGAEAQDDDTNRSPFGRR